MNELEVLRQECERCTACPLSKTRHNVVFGVGPCPSDIVFVGEGPGQQEDLQGEPFVGAAGKLLDDMLSIIDLGRHNCYICNIVKCRPPQNRDPLPQEQEACMDYLRYETFMIKPKIIVCLGRIAATTIIDPEFRITRQRGQWFERKGYHIIATYHPSALLRDATKKRPAWEDMQAIRAKWDELKEHGKRI